MPSRPVRSGVVDDFDHDAGWGHVRSDDGEAYFFHCTGIADGSRTIDVGAAIVFEVVAGHRGAWEATNLQRQSADSN